MSDYEESHKSAFETAASTESNIEAASQNISTVQSEVAGIKTIVGQQNEDIENIFSKMTGVRENARFMESSSNHIISNMRLQSGKVVKVRSKIESSFSGAQSLSNSHNRIIAGHDSAYPPWVYLLEGESRGRSIEVINEIANPTGMDVDFYPSQWSEIYPALLDRKIDIILNVGWPNEQIDTERVRATAPYDHFETTLFLKKEDLEKLGEISPDDLEGKKICAQKGSYTDQDLHGTGCTVEYVNNDIQGFVKLVWNKVFAVATDRRVGEYISEQFFDGQIVPASQPLGRTDVVILCGKDNSELFSAIEAQLKPIGPE
jgi:polar amino acid transport system substrate-binding protein